MRWHSDVNTHSQRNGTEPYNNAHKSALPRSQLVQLEKYCGRKYDYFKSVWNKTKLEAKLALPNTLWTMEILGF